MKSLVEEFRNFQVIEGFPNFKKIVGGVGGAKKVGLNPNALKNAVKNAAKKVGLNPNAVKNADVDGSVAKKADVDGSVAKKADVDGSAAKKADADGSAAKKTDADGSTANKIKNGLKKGAKGLVGIVAVAGLAYAGLGLAAYEEYIEKIKEQEENLAKLEKCVEESNLSGYTSCQIKKSTNDKDIMVNQEKRNAYQVENNKYIDCLEENLEKDCEYDKDIIREFLDIPENAIAKGLLELENIDLVGLLNEVTLITGIFFIIGLILMQIQKSRIQMTGIVMIFLSIVVFIWYNFIRN